MKIVIFAGGLGTRLMEETESIPKPMVEIGGKPILWHIMMLYQSQGFNDFIVCLGYKQSFIKQYFLDYYYNHSDIKIDILNNEIKTLKSNKETFNVTLVDTGLNTNTAGRLNRVKEYIGDQTFMLTYGDGLSDIDLNKLLEFHLIKKGIGTITSVQTSGKFGTLKINERSKVSNFIEKPLNESLWINAGFMVFEPSIFKYLEAKDIDNIQFEKGPLVELSNKGKLNAFKHYGFWKCMDALRDKIELEELWNKNPPWKIW